MSGCDKINIVKSVHTIYEREAILLTRRKFVLDCSSFRCT
jgi:hypothetical protein